MKIPILAQPISAGFPSHANDYIEKRIDLNKKLIKHPAATFFIRVRGFSMFQGGISDQDVLVVDRSLTAQNGQVVVAIIDGLFTIKRYCVKNNKTYLTADNPKYPSWQVKEGQDLEIWGVVTYVIKKL